MILTFKNEIISPTGLILFNPGDRVTVVEVEYGGGYWSRYRQCFVKKFPRAVKILEHPGLWEIECFNESELFNALSPPR